MKDPSTNGAIGRDGQGRFAVGNTGGPGNPHAAKVGRFRTAMFDAVDERSLREAVKALVDEAKKGSVPAIRELLDRLLGKPVEFDLIERIERLEQRLPGGVD